MVLIVVFGGLDSGFQWDFCDFEIQEYMHFIANVVLVR